MPRLTLPPEATTLADAVALAVRDAIAARELVEDTTYSVYQLAELLGVSRSPVREAMLRLADAGLVTIVRNRGFRVVLPTAHDLTEIFEIRLALEPPAVRRVAERADPGDLAGIAGHLDDMARAAEVGDDTAFWMADRSLHGALLRAAGNLRAAGIVEQLRATSALLGPPTTSTGRSLVEILAEHEPIVAAVLAADPPGAELAMRRHLERTGRLLSCGLRRAPGCQETHLPR